MSERKPTSQMAADWQVPSLKSKHQLRFQNKIPPSAPCPAEIWSDCQSQ